MDYSVIQIVVIVIALSLSSFIQSAVGFASALVAIPLLLAAGLELPTAVVVTLLSSAIQNIAGLLKLHRGIDFRAARTPALLRLASIPIGVALMFWLDANLGNDRNVVRQLVGAIVLAILAAQLICRFQPRDNLSSKWIWLAFPVSGVMQGAVGLPGPAIVFWLMAQKWEPDRARGFLFLMFLIGIPPHAILFWALWPEQFFQGLWISLAAIPVVLISTGFGLIAGKRLNQLWLRRITIGLLAGIAISSIVMPMLTNR